MIAQRFLGADRRIAVTIFVLLAAAIIVPLLNLSVSPTSALYVPPYMVALLGKYLCYSRVPGQPRTYVQDRIRTEASTVAALMKDPRTHVYICGLKGMESGVDEAFADVCRSAAIDWAPLKSTMREDGRYHVETY